MAGPAVIRWDVVEEHLDEAAFLWSAWERALVDPEYALREVVEGPEERLLAHLDALVVNGRRAAEKLLLPALAGDEPGPAFAAAWALLASEDGDFVDPVFAALAGAEKEPRAAVVRALGLAPRRDLDARLVGLLGRGSPAERAAALEALAARGQDPGVTLDPLLAARDHALRRAALGAARAFPARATPQVVAALLRAPDPAERAEAIRTGLVLRVDEAWAAVERGLEGDVGEYADAALLWGLSGEADLSPLVRALADEARRPAALFALGFTGRAAAVDAAVPLAADERVAKLAGEVVSSVAGLVIEGGYAKPAQRWDPDAPEAAEREEYGPEDDLPNPAPLALEGWWNGARDRYDLTARYLAGVPWSGDALLSALESGPMRRRPALALDLAVRSRGAARLDARGLARRQLEAVAALRGFAGRVPALPYREVVRLGAPGVRAPGDA